MSINHMGTIAGQPEITGSDQLHSHPVFLDEIYGFFCKTIKEASQTLIVRTLASLILLFYYLFCLFWCL